MKNTDKKIAFFDTKSYDREFFDKINKKYGFDIHYFETKLNKDTANLTKNFNIVCAFVNDNINAEVIDILNRNKVQLIALRCAGYNNVDFKKALKKINVVRVPEYSPYAVAEHAVALILALNRKIHKAYFRTRDGNFSLNGLMGNDLYGKTAGILGTGKIGKAIISILKGFGMNILAYDPYPDKEFEKSKNITYTELDDLYKRSDIISLHCPLVQETENIINKDSINKMKKGVVIINTSRGKLIDTEALIDGVISEKIGYAGLDVYEEESEYFFEDKSAEIISDDTLARLLVFPNVIVTSHQGFFTREAMTNIAETTMENINEFLTGGYLVNEICYSCENSCIKKEHKRCF